MDSLAAYLLRSVIISGVFSAYYFLFLRNKKFHHYNRLFLLSALLISLVAPIYHSEWHPAAHTDPAAFSDLLATISRYNTDLFRTPITGNTTLRNIFLATGSFFLLLLLLKIYRLYELKRTHRQTRMKDHVLIETQCPLAPFSFLDNLFWRSDIPLDDQNGQHIYQHELTHIRERHTYDKLFSQFVVCIFWMNPFYWFLQKELNMIHEFIADAGSIAEGDTASFAGMLLRSHQKGKYLDPTHSFFQSPIKRRLLMIAGARRTGASYCRKLSVMPLILLVVMLFSITSRQNSLKDQQLHEKLAAERADMGAGKLNLSRPFHSLRSY